MQLCMITRQYFSWLPLGVRYYSFCKLKVSQSARCGLRSSLLTIKTEFLRWCDGQPSEIPALSESVLGYAGTMECFCSYWALVSSYARSVQLKGPFSRSSYLRPALLVDWNFHKGGTDVMSRLLKNIKFKYTGLHPKARLVIRMMMLQLSNA